MLNFRKINLNSFGHYIVMYYICTHNDNSHEHSKTIGQTFRHNICL